MDGFICVFCNRRKRREEAYISEKYLGICDGCNKDLPYIPKDVVFAGNEDLSSLFSVFEYTGTVRRTVRRYKFNGQQRYADIFAEVMYEHFKEHRLCNDYDMVTMVPLSRKRFGGRGYNQAEILAEKLADRLGMEFKNNCVFKIRENKIQSLTRSIIERRENVRGVYLADGAKIKGRNILLIDDVYTTGSTMKECARELKRKGAENVLGVTLAKTKNRHV